MKRLLALVGVCLLSTACGSTSSATAPTPTPTTTRIMAVSGDLAFGNVMLGSTADRTFTISNSGNATLTFTSLSAVCCTGSAHGCERAAWSRLPVLTACRGPSQRCASRPWRKSLKTKMN